MLLSLFMLARDCAVTSRQGIEQSSKRMGLVVCTPWALEVLLSGVSHLSPAPKLWIEARLSSSPLELRRQEPLPQQLLCSYVRSILKAIGLGGSSAHCFQQANIVGGDGLNYSDGPANGVLTRGMAVQATLPKFANHCNQDCERAPCKKVCNPGPCRYR